jgi:hypothetical protein
VALTRRSRVTEVTFSGSTLESWQTDNTFGPCPAAPDYKKFVQPLLVGQESQITDSEGHPGWNRRKAGRNLRDIGGDFFTQRQYVSAPSSGMTAGCDFFISSSCRGNYFWKGSCYAIDPRGIDASFPAWGASLKPADLDSVGATMVSRAKPTNAVADLSTFLGELVSGGVPRASIASWEKVVDSVRNTGIHKLSKSQYDDLARRGGSDYLAYEFGYKPVVSDIYKFALGVERATTILRQYERDAGQVVRRRYELPLSETSSTTVSATSAHPVIGGAFGFPTQLVETSAGSRYTVVDKQQRRWFSGAFTYHLPSGYSSRSVIDELESKAKLVLGLELSPEVIWNLTPWSWAVDWFSNIGDVISNISDWANDGLVLRYGYVMEHTIAKRTLTRTGFRLKNQSGAPSPVSFVRETKIRRKANPFGFGVVWSGLTPRQLAIAASLGITR